MSIATQASSAGAQRPPTPRLGEELPVFCERCGYSLHGLPQVRCEHCDILQFHCPECGHHQSINTLRPAFQRLLGRLQAAVLALLVMIKLNYFGWLLFAWFVVGYEYNPIYYHDNYGRYARIQQHTEYWPHEEDLFGVGFSGFAFGLVGRLLVLRWRRHWPVALVLGGLVFLAMFLGAEFRFYESDVSHRPLFAGTWALMLTAAVLCAFGAQVAWWVWSGCVRLFLPTRAAQSLLEWQRPSDPAAEASTNANRGTGVLARAEK